MCFKLVLWSVFFLLEERKRAWKRADSHCALVSLCVLSYKVTLVCCEILGTKEKVSLSKKYFWVKMKDKQPWRTVLIYKDYDICLRIPT